MQRFSKEIYACLQIEKSCKKALERLRNKYFNRKWWNMMRSQLFDNFLRNQFTQIRSKTESCFVSILFLTNFEIFTHLKVEIICFRNSLYGRRDRSVKSSVQSEALFSIFLWHFFGIFKAFLKQMIFWENQLTQNLKVNVKCSNINNNHPNIYMCKFWKHALQIWL